MSNVFLTSDFHLNHSNILKFGLTSRPFNTIEEMNSKIIENWNATIGPGDEVYVLGDFILGKSDAVEDIVSQFQHGVINLVPGNHDTKAKISLYKEIGVNVLPPLYELKYKKRIFVLCHYPMVTWASRGHGSIQAFGHVHKMGDSHRIEDGMPYRWNHMHVGVDDNNLYPWHIDEVIEDCEKRKIVE